jgi:recombination protein RecA
MPRKKKTEEEVQVDPGTDREKALEIVKSAITKQFGAGSIMQGKDNIPPVETFSSGCISLNRALGGGWAKGRMVEVFGPESSGKTTLALHAIAHVQSLGEGAAFIDAEHTFDPSYAANLGVNMDELLFSQPQSAEQGLEILEMLVRSGTVKVVVVDSVAALVPQKEVEGNMGDSNMGVHARLMSQAMRKLAGITQKTGTTIIWINQIRMKIGVMFGNPETVTGGNALKFYSSQRVDVRRTGGVKDGEDLVANSTKAKVVKNKIAPPFRIAEFEIRYGEGIDVVADLINVATEAGVIQKSGSWYSYGDTRIGQGAKQVRGYLLENTEIADEIRAKL